MKNKPVKPTGKLGHLNISHDRPSIFQTMEFPKTKSEIEQLIMDGTLRSENGVMKSFYNLTQAPIQNSENNFDFTLQTKVGIEYLDLMEILPFNWVGGPHEKAPASYNNGDFADSVYKEIKKKTARYRGSKNMYLHLLLYHTDWKLRLSKGVQQLVAYFCLRDKLFFKSIVIYSPDDKFTGTIKILYPHPPHAFTNFNEQAARQRATLLGDFTKIEMNENGTVTVPLVPLSRKNKRK